MRVCLCVYLCACVVCITRAEYYHVYITPCVHRRLADGRTVTRALCEKSTFVASARARNRKRVRRQAHVGNRRGAENGRDAVAEDRCTRVQYGKAALEWA